VKFTKPDYYKRVVEYVQSINDTSGFTEEDQKKIKSIFILPNVELRMEPVRNAEQVIIAKNNDEVLSYDSGSIENTNSIEPLGIRERVCNILEGGDRAFKQREMRYAIKQ